MTSWRGTVGLRTDTLLGKALLLASVLIITLLVGVVYLARPMKEVDYSLIDPDSVQERAGLCRALESDIQSLEGRVLNYGNTALGKQERFMATVENDPDRLFPGDRMRVVLALQKFRIEFGRFPESVDELETSSSLDRKALSQDYRIGRAPVGWILETTRTGIKVARGN